MIIDKTVVERIREASLKAEFEIGGILGSKDNKITNIIIDKGKLVKCACSYEPDIDFLNEHIYEWEKSKIYFKGVFHTHFANVRTLSKEDKDYIVKIMNNMPGEIVELYFPLYVLPECKMIVYKAIRGNGHIEIICDELEIKNNVDKEENNFEERL